MLQSLFSGDQYVRGPRGPKEEGPDLARVERGRAQRREMGRVQKQRFQGWQGLQYSECARKCPVILRPPFECVVFVILVSYVGKRRKSVCMLKHLEDTVCVCSC